MKIGPELDWLSDDNRAGLSDGKDECTPAIRNRAAAATQSECACRHSSSDWQKRWGARRSRDGVRGRDGVLSSFLGASRVAIRPISRFFFQLRIRSFMPRWCFRCVLLRAKEETLRLAKLDRSSHGATADGSSGFISVAITKPTKEISQSNHAGSHAGTASLPDQKLRERDLGRDLEGAAVRG